MKGTWKTVKTGSAGLSWPRPCAKRHGGHEEKEPLPSKGQGVNAKWEDRERCRRNIHRHGNEWLDSAEEEEGRVKNHCGVWGQVAEKIVVPLIYLSIHLFLHSTNTL